VRGLPAHSGGGFDTRPPQCGVQLEPGLTNAETISFGAPMSGWVSHLAVHRTSLGSGENVENILLPSTVALILTFVLYYR